MRDGKYSSSGLFRNRWSAKQYLKKYGYTYIDCGTYIMLVYRKPTFLGDVLVKHEEFEIVKATQPNEEL